MVQLLIANEAQHCRYSHTVCNTINVASPHLPCSKEELKQLFTLNTGKWRSATGASSRFKLRLDVLRPCCSSADGHPAILKMPLHSSPHFVQQLAATLPTFFGRLVASVPGCSVCSSVALAGSAFDAMC